MPTVNDKLSNQASNLVGLSLESVLLATVRYCLYDRPVFGTWPADLQVLVDQMMPFLEGGSLSLASFHIHLR